jgi:acyl carrier protein
MMEGNVDVQKEPAGGGRNVDIREKVKGIISLVTKIPVVEITGEKLIHDDLGVDSMQAIEALAILEKELGIVIDPDEAFNIMMVDDLFKMIEKSVVHSSVPGVV